MSKKRKTEYLFGIPLFSWGEWIESDSEGDYLIFADVEWCFPSMHKYNEGVVLIHGYGKNGGKFTVDDKEGITAEKWKDKMLTDIPEFREQLLKKLTATGGKQTE